MKLKGEEMKTVETYKYFWIIINVNRGMEVKNRLEKRGKI